MYGASGAMATDADRFTPFTHAIENPNNYKQTNYTQPNWIAITNLRMQLTPYENGTELIDGSGEISEIFEECVGIEGCDGV